MGGSEKAPTHFFRGVEVPNCRRTQICAHRRCQSTKRSIRNFFIVNQMNSRRIMCNFLAWIQRSTDNIGHWLSKNRTWVQVQRSGEFMIFIRRPRRWQSNWTLRYSRFNSFQCVFLNDPYPLLMRSRQRPYYAFATSLPAWLILRGLFSWRSTKSYASWKVN